jgi:hypothetical protein
MGNSFFSLMMEKAALHDSPYPLPAKTVEPYARLSVSKQQEPAFILDALNRVHQLDFIPIPWCIQESHTRPVVDMQLAITLTTLNAISCMETSSDIGNSSYSISTYKVECNVCLLD